MATGYSDRINHALAFAAKHLDQFVRRGTRLPYQTTAANVAIVLTRYGRDDESVVAGILYDVVEEGVREGYMQDVLLQRIAEKFGDRVLELVLAVTLRRTDDDGLDLSTDERRSDLLARLGGADDRARWVVTAVAVHHASTIISDLRRTEFPDTVWSRFAAGREGTIRWYRRLTDRLIELGFDAPIVDELRAVTEDLEKWLLVASVDRRAKTRT
jgi:hypothetical protein